MHFDIITLFPDIFANLQYGIIGRALHQQRISLNCWNPRDYTQDNYQRVDDRPYGGGPGMVMLYEPIAKAIAAAQATHEDAAPVIYLSPQGQPLTQPGLTSFAQQHHRLILLCGRYEGIDQRIIDQLIDQEISVGDFVVSGGELPAMLLLDGVSRLIPGVLGHHESAENDSFSRGLLDHPHYTRPATIADQTVPEVLTRGDHSAIKQWRLKQSLGNTWQKRPDLIKRISLTASEQRLLQAYRAEQITSTEE